MIIIVKLELLPADLKTRWTEWLQDLMWIVKPVQSATELKKKVIEFMTNIHIKSFLNFTWGNNTFRAKFSIII